MSSVVENGVEFVKQHLCCTNFIQGHYGLEQDFAICVGILGHISYHITNNWFHIFGTQRSKRTRFV
jgi:hypothetical protein